MIRRTALVAATVAAFAVAPPGFAQESAAQPAAQAAGFYGGVALRNAGVESAGIALGRSAIEPTDLHQLQEDRLMTEVAAALETVLEKHATLTAEEIVETAEHWRRSYLNTPHGKPIAFSREWQDSPEHEGESHDHHHRHDDEHHHPSDAGALQPIAISPPAAVKKPSGV